MQFSNDDKDVFLVKLERMIDRGALLSRYSRAAALDIRDIYRKEFEGNEDKGRDFYRKIFLEYGDESIAELVTAQISLQNISNVATKTIEELRVGLSYLEKSSRYVRYDRKHNDRYLYLQPEKLELEGNNRGVYEETCEGLFQYYAENYDKARDFFRKKYPIDTIMFSDQDSQSVFIDDLEGKDRENAEKSYNSSIRARALDDLRFLLPASTLTNLGISGNGRAFIGMIQKLSSSASPEAMDLARAVYTELQTELPELIDSAFSRHGNELIEYKEKLDSYSFTETGKSKNPGQPVELLSWEDDEKSLKNSLSILAFTNGQDDVKTSREIVENETREELDRVVLELAALRSNRRHKLHRAFESVPYTFQITTNYGAFRDLQRHRFISINRQNLSNRYGFDIPEYFAETGEREEYINLMQKASQAYKVLLPSNGPQIAQYVIPYAFRYPVIAHLNLREAAFFCELRSTPQAHPDLRKIAVSMFRSIVKVNPGLAPLIKFVDTSEYALGRLKSEQSKERKLRDMDHGK